ncbi:hypothetical protein SLS56_007696 [Neofusicoccum ribis]|uniref:Rhodanese domain-containing protein n=1 Tax=Neofusicoccum ribis TaxID=45134 RepID=A0ABR3SNU0_9PEZI
MPIDLSIASLQHEIASCERQLQRLKQQLAEAEARSQHSSSTTDTELPGDAFHGDANHNTQFLGGALGGGLPDEWQAELWAVLEQPARNNERRRWPLELGEYRRYGRQLIVPQVGLQDGDTVEESNLHRQILHSTSKVGMSKVESALKNLKWSVYTPVEEETHRQLVDLSVDSLNPNVKYYSYNTRLNPANALDIFSEYDLVLDCTDTPASRYLISDTCVLLGKPLVSASALRTEGQLMVLNNPPRPPGDPTGGPCYRCVFPKPPPAESVVSCGEGGILGPVVGVMGVLQALEAIKLIAAGIQKPQSLSSDTTMDIDGPSPNNFDKPQTAEAAANRPTNNKPSLLLFSAYSNPQFRTFGLRTRKLNCAACSAQATVTHDALISGSMDYVQFCGAVSPVDALAPEERISALDYDQARSGSAISGSSPLSSESAYASRGSQHILVDVREKVQFDLAHLDGSINIPFSDIVATAAPAASTSTPASVSTPATPATGSTGSPSSPKQGSGGDDRVQPAWLASLQQMPAEQPIVVTCRLGNDSQLAVRKMKALGLDDGGKRKIVDVKGGLKAWRETVDAGFPDY